MVGRRDAAVGGLRFSAALSTAPDTGAAVDEVCRQALADLAAPVDLAVFFVSHDHADDWPALSAELARRLSAQCLLGCTGESIVGGRREIESAPALSLWLAHLPGAEIAPVSLSFEQTVEGGTITGWPDALVGEWPAAAELLLLAEPFSFPADYLLARLNEDRPGVPVVGGMASGAAAPGENRVFLNGRSRAEGAVGALISGAVQLHTVVSQGCRPVGRPYVITKADQNLLLELSGQPALVQLRALFEDLPPDEQRLVNRGLHVGRVINEYQDEFRAGDFLIRNCLGADQQSQAIAVGDFLRAGQTVQVHVRDEQSADADLRAMLAAARPAAAAQGALLFTCNGRGTRLFSQADHDATVVQQVLGEMPLAGFFAQGEMGPVGGKNFLHGFTASVALFGPRGTP